MKTSTKTLSLLFAMSFVLLSTSNAVATTSAQTPSWEKGQTWAVGGQEELENLLGENYDKLNLTMSVLELTLDEPDMSGSASSWMVFMVTDVSDDEYILNYSAGARFTSDVSITINGSMYSPGSYQFINATKEERVVTVDMSFGLALTSHGYFRVARQDMSILNMTTHSVVDQTLSFEASNIPSFVYGKGTDIFNVTVSYQDYSVSETLHASLSLNADFAPAIKLVKFPLSAGSSWAIDSTATINGKVTGYLNTTGLPQSVLENLTGSADTINGNLLLEGLAPESMPIDNGTIGPTQQKIGASMSCVNSSSVNVIGRNVTSFDIVETKSGGHYYYSPEIEFLTMAMVQPEFDSIVDRLNLLPRNSLMPSFELDSQIEMHAVEPVTANAEIAKIGSYQGVGTEILRSTPEEDSSAKPFDMTMIFIAIAVIASIAVIAVILVMRGKGPRTP